MGKEKTIKELMTEKVKTVNAEASVLEAATLMDKHSIGALVVVKSDDQPVGIFTERDLLKKVVVTGKGLDIPVAEVMTSDFVCIQVDDPIETLPELMIKGNFRHVPVLYGFNLVGIISIKDLLRHLVAK